MERREFLVLGLALTGGLAACGRQDAGSAAPSAAPAAAPASVTVLDAAARAALDVLGEALVPGAAAAGFSAWLESQLAARPGEGMLMLRYLGVPPPWQNFYLPALQAAEAWSSERFGRGIAALAPTEAAELVADIASGKPASWNAAPAPFFYFVLRADALDVAYGTRAGFERLGIPYMAHIAPTKDW
ncbi:MAG: gluconate 2-dehydrogenase subunit 3 family protein [Gammaproteobacteria bacterium]